MARAEKDRPRTLEEAVAELRRDPARPVQARVDDLEVELRVVTAARPEMPLGDWMAAGGGWQGEPPEAVIQRIREARVTGTSPDTTGSR